ncbi:DNA (cytosine-5)-methyltransferase 3A [Lamellibrachia satsuma]|nr:DNA (cytosine-5)-methyltransferase 3A [Lamellibrachia satsuma]
MWNAKYFSAQNRARYFWGNIPGMYCPPELSPCPLPEIGLDSSLMGGRTAAVHKVRTVTTRSNSLMQGKKDDYFPVYMGATGDTLWIPELERLFGFPEHYTDVGNIPPTRRQKLLGKAWSVPLIKHILAPLKSFYGCLPDGPRVARETEMTHL